MSKMLSLRKNFVQFIRKIRVVKEYLVTPSNSEYPDGKYIVLICFEIEKMKKL
jgi:hypothetical protein